MRTLFERITGPMDPEFPGVRFPEPDHDSPSELYHEVSKMHRSTAAALGARIDMFLKHQALQAAAAHPYKRYDQYQRVELPEPSKLTMEFGQALLARRCVRSFSQTSSTPLQAVADWLGWGCGLVHQEQQQPGPPRRTYPSGGGLYPLEIYVAVRNVQGLPPGLYHYYLPDHSLEVLGGTELASEVFDNLTQEDAARSSHLAVLISAVFMRSQYKYGERGYRFVLLEAGHVMQNLCLLAPALGLGVTPIGGYYDDRVHDLLGVDGVNEAVVYTAASGLLAT